ncbi:unnamed protein product [Rotaria magnacalcarata]|uniref:Transmembrane protein 231 n=4 Tax=Rotaria magnacalcarata TaxID=392030 RepID=A0A815LLR3_9BILA|nr:unnamed protein product [Rotaria magnacalcarata]CAF1480171.1 unnamed protein product [Rotaria magnacalcarata]CAF1933782.1 unnamed protein product [Rotaria magnacalcarata]CAF2055515.1 unnamed protein product [Rotaria magnacalcarata]CAF2149410.1 unnamed protein product [Rotaria magnacalcarata]
MNSYELFSHPDRFSYRARLISGATFVFISCLALTYLPPFLLTYYTGEFWTQESTYSEQPRLSNRTKYILIVDNDNVNNNKFFLSSYSTLNNNLKNVILSGYETESSYDIDGDGLLDQFRISFNLIFSQTNVVIRNINIWLIFEYELSDKQRVNMESMALINIVPPSTFTSSNNKNLTVYGQLVFEQRQTIRDSGSDSTYNKAIIDATSSTSTPDLQSILDEYFARKYYTSFETQYTWITPQTTVVANTVAINAVVNIGRQAILYTPGFWQDFKWGWIQYVCVLAPFLIVFSRLKLFAFSNHLVQTLFPLPYHQHKA